MQNAYSASRIFTGTTWLENHTIITENNSIKEVTPHLQPEARWFPGQMIVPAFIDAQVYGAAGKLLSVYPEPSTLQTMYEEFKKQGTILCQPTLATNTMDVFKNAIDAVRAYWQGGGKGIYGLHLEGPWINEVKRGAHIKEWIHVPEVEEVQDILEYGKGVITMITIAPEVCSDEVTGLIKSYGVVMSAGHSNATYKQAINSFVKGVTTITHLYNAMSPLQHRAPGLVGAAFNHGRVRSSIIPDGHHVDFAAVAIAKKIMGHRLFAITDAVTETTSGPYQHQLADNKYESNGILSGSAISMHQALVNLVHQVRIDPDEALRMCSLYPAEVLGCHKQYGRIAPGYTAQFLVLNNDLSVAEIIT
jgi:N-acetylglucosamine-6-phosphate deacetylase